MRKLLVVLLMVVVLFTGGCWDQKEITDLALVVAVAVDLGKKVGEEVIVTAQIANPRALLPDGGGGGGPGGPKPFWTISGKGRTIRSAIFDMAHRVPKYMFFGQTRLHIVGEELAKEGIASSLDRPLRSRQARPNQYIAVARGSGKKVLEVEMPTFRSSGLALISLFELGNQHTTLPVQISDFEYRLSTKYGSPIAPLVSVVPQSSVSVADQSAGGGVPKTLQVKDLAIFDYLGRMVGTFNETETLGLMWALNKVQLSEINVDSPVKGTKQSITLDIGKSRAKTIVRIGQDGIPRFEVEVEISADIAEHYGEHSEINKVWYIKSLEKRANTRIEQEIRSAVRQAQLLNADVFLFSEEVRRQHYREWLRIKDNWLDIFPMVEVKIKTKTRIVSRGLTVETPGMTRED